MYNVNRMPILNIYRTIFITKKTGTIIDDDLNQKEVFDEPKKYRFNVQIISADSEIREFGELANNMLSISITNKSKYIGKFHEFDKVYVDTTPTGELENGDNADYRIYSVRNQNASIRIYLLKLVK